MKFLTALVCVLVLVVFSTASDAHAQTYQVCNSSPVSVWICVWVDCGLGSAALIPCIAALPPGQCFTWPIGSGCTVTDIQVNGTLYAVQPAGTITPLISPPPPTQILFGVATATVQ